MTNDLIDRGIHRIHPNAISLQRLAQASGLGPLLMVIDTIGTPPTVCRISNHFQD